MFPKYTGTFSVVKRVMQAMSLGLGPHPMQIVDLRQLSSWQLDPLLSEEAQQWQKELQWDYRASVELIKKFVDARSLTGSAIMENGRPVGYAFYVLEEHKGLVGGLFVSLVWLLGQRLLVRFLIGPGYTAYGIVGSFIAVMIWVYYVSVILFLGAELVEALAIVAGRSTKIDPSV